ncbi:DUF3718 domain-containing protein [Aliiglaciecola sp. 3_MG-2023]|uniref:DUF3718 domain-containing protein n=1 Tax=Aliiglaciecola sp. 3_MG-2023 TaxID=3062644 RepID=UPI0026E2B206|nr:DUF3718 domain-containing protein [Aliiglaciecola sp. 3_MG-2023]MDO6691971.1 DUF3718 domain-containing protein [Aliiglaciecola sp. 3_MG-2023]
MKILNSVNNKKVMLIAIMLGAFASNSAFAASHLTSYQQASLVKVCKALKSDSRIQLQKAVKSSNLNYKKVAKGLMCNGQSALEFAAMHDAHETAGFLARKVNVNYDKMLAKR